MPEEPRVPESESASESPAQAEASASDALEKALEEERQRAEGYLANWKRAEADLANYKKRAEQEKQEITTFANAMLVSSLLTTLDDLGRALDGLDSKLTGLTWTEGVRLVYRKLQVTLESQGLSVINTVGAAFDPKLHEAVMEVDGEPGKVVSELQKGYKFRDRVIRPAVVAVGRGAKPGEPEQRSAEASSNG